MLEVVPIVANDKGTISPLGGKGGGTGEVTVISFVY